MLFYLAKVKTNEIREFDIPVSEANNLINSGLYRKVTPQERVDFVRTRANKNFNTHELIPSNLLDVYFVCAQGRNDGYSSGGEALVKYAKRHGIYLNRNYTGQKIGILHGHPTRLNELKTPYKIIWTGIESTNMPKRWIPYLKKFDEIWTFSAFCQRVMKKSLKINSRLIQYGVDTEVFTYKPREESKVFTFVHYDAFKWRKGWDLVVKAFNRAFGENNEDVQLILKTTAERVLPLDYKNIKIVKGKFKQERLVDEILHKSNCMVFPSRGEGFGMTPLEALATGATCITVNAHGISDYFGDFFHQLENPVQPIPAKYDNKDFLDEEMGFMWEMPIDEIAKQMVMYYDMWKLGNDQFNEYGAFVSKRAQKYSIDNTAKKMAKRIKFINKKLADKLDPELSIIMLTYNALDWTKKAVESIFNASEIEHELIIIDNKSTDGTREWLKNLQKEKKGYPLKVILNRSNKGVAGGRNQGIELSSGHYCVFLDNDVEVSKGWDTSIIRHFRSNPHVWVVGNGGNFVENFSPLVFKPSYRHLDYQFVDVVAGYCFAFPKHITKLIGMQYEGLGRFWHEDLEFCMRIKKYGRLIVEDRSIPIIHHAHKSAGENVNTHQKVKEIHKGFDERAKMVGLRIQDNNVLTIFNDGSNPNSAYTRIADNITEELRKLGLVVLRKPKPFADGHIRPKSFDLCNAFDMSFNGKSLIYLHTENDNPPEEWKNYFDLVDYVLCGSGFIYEAISKMTNKARFVPLSGVSKEYKYDVEPMLKYPQGVDNFFTFAVTGASQPRKGTDLLIKAFCEEFAEDEPVQLIIKNYNYGKEAWVREQIAKYENHAPIFQIYEDWTTEQMAEFYKKVSLNGCFVLPHRAEGVGMTQREALACGCRIITTGFGGTRTLDKYGAYLLNYRLVNSTFHNNDAEPYYQPKEHPKWAEPDLKELKLQMRTLLNTPLDIDLAKGVSESVIDKAGFKTLSDNFYDFLKTL